MTLPYGRQSIDKNDIKAVTEALQGDMITRGPIVGAFEQAVAERSEAPYAVAFSSGTSALAACYHAADTQLVDTIISTANTFVGTVSEGMKMGARLQLTDIDAKGNMCLDTLKLNTPRSRGKEIIVPVHFAGVPVDMERLSTMVMQEQTVVIEDAAHAFGSRYKNGKPVGSCIYSDMTVFSFHPLKAITTGEGGMVLTQDRTLYERLKQARNNGFAAGSYSCEFFSGNYNMTEFQAALGLSQLKRLDTFKKKRTKLINAYLKELKTAKPLFEKDDNVNYHIAVVEIDNRDAVREVLKEAGIETQVHYAPLYTHSAIRGAPLKKMEAYYKRALTLPLHCEMSEKDIKIIAGLLA